MKRIAVSILLVMVLTGAVSGSRSGYTAYTTWADWARLRLGETAELASSYDRTGDNDDYSRFESPEGFVYEQTDATIKTIDGPGILYRIWMPHVAANHGFALRMFFDGEQTARLTTTTDAILGGTFNYFADPLVNTFAGGQVCYEPIPFSQSLRIETTTLEMPPTGWSSKRYYYQYSFVNFPAGTAVDSYTGSLTEQQQQERSDMVSLFDNAGQHPAGENPAAIVVAHPTTAIPAGLCLTVADLTGPGVVRSLRIRMDNADDVELEGLQLKLYYDGNDIPAVDVSVGNFFGAGDERASYQSIPLGADLTDPQVGLYCYWPMPFRQSILVKLCNTTGESISIDAATVEYESGPIDADMCYLHAVENSSAKQDGDIYHQALSTTGRGHYVGELLYIKQIWNSFYMLEGDDVIVVDGSKTLYGTGLEDIYNGGYYYNWVAAQADEPEGIEPRSAIRPLNGILFVHRESGFARADQYRWRIADAIPFTRSIEVSIENRYAVSNRAQWTSVAFWYQLPCPLEDLDGDCDVDGFDFDAFGARWGQTNCGRCGGADFTGDQNVNVFDLREIGEEWLAGASI